MGKKPLAPGSPLLVFVICTLESWAWVREWLESLGLNIRPVSMWQIYERTEET